MTVFSGPQEQQVPGAVRDRLRCAVRDADRSSVIGGEPESVSRARQVLLENVANVRDAFSIELAAALKDPDYRLDIGVSRCSYHA